MTTKAPIDKTILHYYRITAAVALLWTFTVICSASWNVYNGRLQTLALAKKEAVANFNKDLAFRLWGTKHGGVYVPPTAETPPNPYLSHIPGRDLLLPSGKRLTLMNPAYMVRQMMADFHELYGIEGRITSLKPLNPANAPDAWEREALTAFEKGSKELFVVTDQAGEQTLRLMRPLTVKAGCLKCHAQQGYKEGDIRGGVGVMVPMASYRALEKKTTNTMILSHLGIWLLGMTVLGLVLSRGRRFILEQMQAEEALRESEVRFRRFFAQVPLPLCYVNQQGALVYLNDRFVQVFGYTHDDVPTLTEWWQLAYPDEEYRRWVLQTWGTAVANAARQGTDIAPGEYQVTCKDGTKRDCLIGGITLEENLLATFIDMTARKQDERQKALAEEALRKLNSELEQRVQERTTELATKNRELERLNKVFVGRELRMIELKERIQELEEQREGTPP